MENAKCYAPQILVGTEGLPREQWLEYRRKGIGGSDAAAVLGISPFRTGRDLYYDKLNIVTADDAENWVQLEVGTLLEPLVAKIFAHKTGYKIYRRPFMFRHPQYPWMLADLDYMVELPDGTTAILEIKTTNYNAKDNWWYNGEEIVPIYYESQGRHYMAVMNIDRVYFCCLYGNSEDEAIIRRIDRDMAYEEELIALERDFWENHVLTKTPPPYVEADGDLILESLRRKLGPADKDAPPVLLGQPQFGQLSMGTTSGSPIHFVGDPCSRVVYVTEGCLKADVAHALMHRTFVATLGANNTAKLDELFAFLHRNGTEEIIEAEDMDKYSNEMVGKGASKIYALAARHGMRCRRLTWNPNYKGIDDWQLALRRKEQKMKEDPGMTFKEQYLNGLCGLEMLEACTEKWHVMKVDSISLREYLGLTEQEYDAYLQTAPGVSFQELLDSQRKTQRFRVYQLDLEHGETRAFAFGGIDALHKAGFQQPPAAEYTLVYDGELICPVGQDERDILERIFARYNQAFPPDYRGRSIAPSDVLELYDESERRYFYCDMAGFLQVKFSPALAKKA